MEHRDTLLTLAEIAVALAGFTGLVGVLGRGGAEDASSGLSWLRLRTMLEVALRNAAFALMPLPLLGVVSSETAIWRVSSGIYLVTVIAYILYRLRTNPSMTDQALSGWFLSLTPISLLACLANVLGLAGPHAFSLYLLSLLLGLITAGMLFLSVASTFFHDERP
jgi:hypothetical protein